MSAERSALAVVKFVHDRHRYSGEQLANVLTADGFLCYRDEDSRVSQSDVACGWLSFVVLLGFKGGGGGEVRSTTCFMPTLFGEHGLVYMS